MHKLAGMTTQINFTELRNELADINAVLGSGVSKSNVDSTSIEFDFEALRKRKREIESQLPETRNRRPRVLRARYY